MNTSQRLSAQKLKKWESLRYGMFIHYGMNTYEGLEFSSGTAGPEVFNPTNLDTDQWARTAKEAGMRYAVLTTKHTSGFCLWHSEHTDYHSGHSSSGVDVVASFVESCHKYDILPGFYYCSWDEHHTFGRPGLIEKCFGQETDNIFKNYPISREYEDLQLAQVSELLSNYGDIMELWIDIPGLHSQGYREHLYETCASIQPDCVIVMNNGFFNKQGLVFSSSWPTDVLTIERGLPHVEGWNEEVRKRGRGKYNPIVNYLGNDYNVPAEVCDTVGGEWFYDPNDHVKPIAELAGMVNITNARGCNMLLNVGPTPEGLIAQEHVDTLLELKNHLAYID